MLKVSLWKTIDGQMFFSKEAAEVHEAMLPKPNFTSLEERTLSWLEGLTDTHPRLAEVLNQVRTGIFDGANLYTAIEEALNNGQTN